MITEVCAGGGRWTPEWRVVEKNMQNILLIPQAEVGSLPHRKPSFLGETHSRYLVYTFEWIDSASKKPIPTFNYHARYSVESLATFRNGTPFVLTRLELIKVVLRDKKNRISLADYRVPLNCYQNYPVHIIKRRMGAGI